LNWHRETDQGFAEDRYIIKRATEVATEFKLPVELVLARWGYVGAANATKGGGKPVQQQGANQGGDNNKDE